MTPQQIIDAVGQCEFPGYTFDITLDAFTAYISASYEEADTITSLLMMQKTRTWPVDIASASKSAIVLTCFKCILTSMEHKTREWFLYNGKPILNPHPDVDALWSITEER